MEKRTNKDRESYEEQLSNIDKELQRLNKIKAHKEKIAELKEKIAEKKTIVPKQNNWKLPIAITAILILIFTGMFLGPTLTGFVTLTGTGQGQFYEDWETGSSGTNGWTITAGPTSGWIISTSEGPLGTYHAIARNTDGETILENDIDTTGYQNIAFSFSWSTDTNGFDSNKGEYFYADWYDGTSWTNLFSHTSGSSTTYQQASYNLPSNANNNANLKIRFRCNINHAAEGCNIDNINVSGTEIDITPPSTITNLDIQSRTNNSIYWTWTNPIDSDFSENIIYLDNNNILNTTNNYYNATSLQSNTEYTIKVHTIDTNNNINTTDVTNTNKTLANIFYGISLTDPIDQTVNPNTNATYTITVTNIGNAIDSYTLSIINENGVNTALLNQSTITNLENGTSQDIALTVEDSTAGTYIVKVNATSDNDNSKSDEISIITNITSSTNYNVNLNYNGNQQTTENKNVTYNITITNTGNTIENITLTTTDYNGADTALLNQTTILNLNESESTIIQLTVGDSTPGIYIIELNATVDNDPTKYNLLNITTTVQDTIPPSSITNLNNISKDTNWIYWTWTNPIDSDFSENIIYLDNINILNTSNNYYNATGLNANTEYTIKIHTIDANNNINTTDVTNTAKTPSTDPIAPTINSISDNPDPLAKNQNITITINATDNLNLSSVWIKINNTNYTLTQDSGSLGTTEQIFTEGFESGTIISWTTSGTGTPWYLDASNPNTEIYHITALKTSTETIISKTINTIEYQNITIRFYTETTGLDPADWFRADWYDGATWTQLIDAEDINSYTEYSYPLPSNANDNPNFAIRFKCKSGNNEYCYVDDINITGKPFSDPQPDIWRLVYNTSNAVNGLNYYSVYAKDSNNNIAEKQSNFTVMSAAIYNITLTQPENKTTNNVTTANYEINITNNGNIIDSYTLTAINYNGADTASLNQTTISNLAPSETKTFKLSVTSSTIGNYTIGINATSNSDSSTSALINITTEIIEYIPPPTNALFYDGFESGSLVTNSWISEGTGTPWFIETSSTYSGTYHAEAGGPDTETILRNNINTTGFGNIEFSFYWDTDLLDGGEYLSADWSDGTSWINLLNTNSNPGAYQYETYTLPSNANNNPNFAIRFRCLSNLKTEECKIDEVIVTGEDIYNPIVTNINPQSEEYNINNTIQINATITDNINISYVYANISWNSNSQIIELTDLNSDNTYEVTFTNTSIGGLYNIRIIANDTSNNINNTETSFFQIKTAPTIIDISDISSQSITESSVNEVEFYILASDLNEVNDLNDTSIETSFSKTGETTRIGSCSLIEDINSTTANYSCTVGIWYWDGAGTWNITATINDSSAMQSEHYIETFLLLETTAIVLSPTSMAWSVLYPNDINKLATNNPVIINNTGNKDIALNNIRIQSYDLIGQTNPSYKIPASNFTINTNNVCEGTQMQNNSIISISNSILPAGNNTAGQEELYYCIEHVPPNLTQQTYSSPLNWIVDVT